jgi:hypothetical protein
MTVRAKFYVSDLQNPEGATAAQVSLNAVCRGVENAIWSQATPSGSITMYVKNDPAFEQFEKGAEYEVTFRKVPKPTPGDGHQIKPTPNMHGWVVCETCGQNLCVTAEQSAQAGVSQVYAEGGEKHLQNIALHDEVYGTRN